MSPLETPLKHVLREVTTPASVARMWNRIEARGRFARREPRRASAHRLAFALAFAAALVVLVGGVVGLFMHRGGPDALALVNGPLPHVVRASEGPSTLALSDGSTLALDEHAAIEVVESSATVVRLKQSLGGVLYDIKPGGPRRWTIEYGPVTVDVIGTSFRVEGVGTGVRVAVTRGTVLVRGDRVPGRVAQLTAGMKLEVDDPSATTPSTAPAPTPEPSRAEVVSPPASESSSPPPAPITLPAAPSAWRDLAKRGEHERAYAELGSAGVARAARSASVDDLLTLADVARLSGHPADSVDPLQRVVNEHRGDSRASLAAFTLGRLHLDSLHAPAAAARAFEQAIALGIPGGLAEDAYAHLTEARAKAGDPAGAKAAYDQYVKRFPNGTRRAELRRWVPGATDPGP